MKVDTEVLNLHLRAGVLKGASPSLIVAHTIKHTARLAGSKLDFVFCAGDDSTDELMFGSLKAKLGETGRGRGARGARR